MKNYILYIVLFISFQGNAQNEDLSVYFGLGGGWMANNFDVTSLNTMIDGYNTDYGGDFKPFESFNPGYGLKINVNSLSNHFAFNGTWNWSKTSQTNTFMRPNKFGRSFELVARDVNLILGFGYGNKIFQILGDIGFGYRVSEVKSGLILPDGTLSYGNSNQLNGIFQSAEFPLYYGATVDFRIIKYLHIQGSFNFNTILFKGDGTDGFVDNNTGRGLVGEALPYADGIMQGQQYSLSVLITIPYTNKDD